MEISKHVVVEIHELWTIFLLSKMRMFLGRLRCSKNSGSSWKGKTMNLRDNPR